MDIDTEFAALERMVRDRTTEFMQRFNVRPTHLALGRHERELLRQKVGTMKSLGAIFDVTGQGEDQWLDMKIVKADKERTVGVGVLV